MALRTAGSVLVVFLWSVAVVLGQDGWSVTYTTQSICTLKGSTVDLFCSYTYPSVYTVTTTFWFTKIVNLRDDPDNNSRVTNRRDGMNVHTLKITDLRESDSAEYKFRFITDQTGEKYTGDPGVTLSVTDLQVKVTTTWWSTTLTCSTTCTLTGNPTYTWYRNSKIVQEFSPSYTFYFKTEDRFYCAVKGINSPAVYGPKNTSVSVSPSGEIVEGSSVTLTCSSDANPPVDKYTWYKKKVASPKASGQSYSITNIISEDRGEYYCEAQNTIASKKSIAQMIIVTGKQTSVLTAAVGITVFILVLILFLCCFMWFRRSTGGSDVTADTQSVHPDPNSDTYTALNMKTRSPEYDTLANVRDSSSDTVPQIDAEPSDYENCREPPHNLD
ncbi:B-cell receptor CD22-like [Oncorhynchus masou masou]|uniref:B-cell receptor CD22-like n=1 Tax=Oncorhynchus masou masou TaxID=90313 RepID=UPI003182EB3D